MTKVLHINSNYLTSKLHENLIDRLESNKINNTIFMPIKTETKEEFLYESKHDVYHPVSFKNLDKFLFTYKQRKIYKKLHEMIKVKEYDVVHAHTLFTDGNIAYQLKKEYDIPYIVTVRGYTDIDSFFKIRLNLRNRGREILKHASKVIFLTDTNKNDLLDKYIQNKDLKELIENKLEIIPNGIDSFYFNNEGNARTLDTQKEIKFIQVGKVIQRKNGIGSIKAIKKFQQDTGYRSKLTFVGDIVDKSYAEKIKNEGQEMVKFIGNSPMEELINIYRQSDIFIMPSFSETFGLVYPEAMSQGLPVIYTKGQGFDGNFEEGYVGYAVNADDPNDIAEKIELIVDNYEMISRNVLEAYKKFNWDNLSKKYIEMYTQLS